MEKDREGNKSDGEMKEEERSLGETHRLEKGMAQCGTSAPRPPALHVLISQIDCIDFIQLMWKICLY